MTKAYKIFALSVPTVMVGTMVVTPIVVHYQIDEKTLYVPEKNVIVNSTTGAGRLTIPLNDEALEDKVMVSAINRSGDNLVTLFLDGQNPFSNENSLVYPVIDGNVNVNFSFSKFQPDNKSTVFDLEFDYINKHGHTKTKFAHNMTLSTNYVQNDIDHVHIVSINDFHGAAEGYGDLAFSLTSPKNPGAVRVMNKVSDYLINNPGSIFLSAGDNNSGDAFSSATHAETLFPVLKGMGVAYSAVGNHAFEWGYDDLTSDKYDALGRTDQTLGHYLINANILEHPYYQDHVWMFNPRIKGYDEKKAETDYNIWKNQHVHWADPYKLVNLNGHLVCIVGLTTQKAMTDGNQAIVKNTSMIDYAASIYYATQYCYDTVGADWYNSIETFVMLTHVESDQKSRTQNDAYSIGEKAVVYDPEYKDDKEFQHHNDPNKKVSLVISGHSHQTVNNETVNDYTGQTVKVGQASTAGRAFLDSDFVFDNTKPVGQRWVSVDLDVPEVKPDWGDVKEPDPSKWTEEEKAEALASAKKELDELNSNPRNSMVESTVNAYFDQRKIALDTLQKEIAHSETGHPYSPLSSGKDIGHEYIMPSHVVEPAGSWVSAASIVGFDFLFEEEIASKTSPITFPAISFIQLDSINGEIEKNKAVKLENMYNMQTHDNTIHFGFLSVWQLAAIIDYMLAGGVKDDSGKTYFLYGTDERSYVDYPDSQAIGHPEYKEYAKDRNLEFNYHAKDEKGNPIQLVTSLENKTCCYPAGPMQWYGFRFNVKAISGTEEKALGRSYKLNYVEKHQQERYKDLEYDYYPDIYIYDPLDGTPLDTFYQPDQWIDVQEWLVRKEDEFHGLIPCLINDFIYSGGNHQFGMLAKYFDFNRDEFGKSFESYLFSTLTRDLMIEYANETQEQMYEGLLDFDGTNRLNEEIGKTVTEQLFNII